MQTTRLVPSAHARRLLLAGLAAVLFALSAPATSAYQVPVASHTWRANYFEADADTLSGYLHWNQGKGGIAWHTPVSSEDPVGPAPSPTEDAQTTAAFAGYSMLGEGMDAFGQEYAFTAQPLPRTLNLNPMKGILVELFVTARGDNSVNYDPCGYYTQGGPNTGAKVSTSTSTRTWTGPDPALRVELWDGEKLVSGNVLAQSVYWYYIKGSSTRPTDPQGYSSCRYALQAEVPTLLEGTVLTLKVRIDSASTTFQLGMAEDHQSRILIHPYSAEEWFFRDPERAGDLRAAKGVRPVIGQEPDGGSGNELVDKGSDEGILTFGALGLLGVAGLGLRARNRRTLLAIGVLLAMGVAGCVEAGAGNLEESDEERKSTAKSRVEDVDPTTGLASADLGTIIGLVHDAQGFPIRGAHISVLNTDNFTQSNAEGAFTLQGVEPGKQTLRVDKNEYLSVQTKVDVVAAKVTRVDVELAPTVAKAGDDIYHLHDYWDSDEMTIFEENLGVVCLDGDFDCEPETNIRLLSDANTLRTILPGTYEIEVTIDWSPEDMGVSEVGLVVQNNQPGSLGNYSMYYPRGPDVPFRVQTSWEMADPGHDRSSAWTFALFVAHDQAHPTVYDNAERNVFKYEETTAPEFSATIKLKKGVVPLEAPHPDHWGNKLEITTMAGRSCGYAVTSTYPPGSPNFLPRTCYFYATEITPALARQATITVTQARETLPAFGWTLYYKPADVPRTGTYWSTQSISSDFEPVPATASVEGLVYTWVVPIAPEEVDPYYATSTDWVFALLPEDETDAWLDYKIARSSVSLTMDVVISKV